MLTVEDIAQRLALSPWQTRRIIYAMRPLLQGLCLSAPGRPLAVNPQAISLLERAKKLHLSGIPLGQLCKHLQTEMGKPSADGQNTLALEPAKAWQELIAELRARIESLERDKAYLQKKLDEALAQRALPPPRRSWLAWLLRR